MKYSDLVKNIEDTHSAFFNQMANVVNQSLTIRNWVIGYYIVEYEQKGNDRAQYGTKMVQTLAEKLNQKGLSYRNLNLFRKFYVVYPEIMQLLTAQSVESQFPILQLATAELRGKIKPILESEDESNSDQTKSDSNLFVSKYMLELPNKSDLERFLKNELLKF